MAAATLNRNGRLPLVLDGQKRTYFFALGSTVWATLVVHPDGTCVYDSVASKDVPVTATWSREALATGNWTDGYADDAEYLDNVGCADCGKARLDCTRCDVCDVTDCSVESFHCDGGGHGDGMDLCEEHTPNHSGCRHCDPVMPWEN